MADTVLTDLKIHDFDSLAQMLQHESEIGDNDLVLTPDLSCRLPLLTPMWFDHIANDVSWLRADTFSWQSGDVYVAAYEHLANELKTDSLVYAWEEETTGYTEFTRSDTPSVGDLTINGTEITVVGSEFGDYISVGSSAKRYYRAPSLDMLFDSPIVDTIGDITITYYLAKDGHKICLPDQESNIVALYEATGVAWYYLLDTENKQFKLPRTKWGFTGLRDSVGGYVEPGLPNITAKFRTGSWKTDDVSANTSGAATQTKGGNIKAYEGGTNAYTYVDTTIDASRSSTIYKDGATVQPPATQMYLYFYVGNFEQSAVEQTAGITAETLNGKADRDLGNLPSNIDYVVESQLPTADNGYTWYRKYKSGWVEQGGYKEISTGGSAAISLPIAMVDTNYAAEMTPASNASGSSPRFAIIKSNLTTTTIMLNWYSYNDGQAKAYWQVGGMSAQ